MGKNVNPGTSLAVQWLRLHAPNTEGLGSILSWGNRFHMPQFKTQHIQVKKKKNINPTTGIQYSIDSYGKFNRT